MISRATLQATSFTLLATSTLVLLTAFGCVGTEGGNPPIIDEDKIVIEISDVAEMTRSIGLEGAALGATEVQYVGIGSAIRPVRVPVNEDGSFEFFAPTDSGVLRFQAINDAGRSPVVDVNVGDGVLSSCMIDPEPTFLELRESMTVTMPADCGGVSDQLLQFGDAGFSVPVRRTTADGRVLFDVTHDGRLGESEDLLLIVTDGGVVATSLYACPDCESSPGRTTSPLHEPEPEPQPEPQP